MSKRCRTANLAPGFVLHGSIPRWMQSTNHNLSFMTNVQTVRTSVSLPNPNPRLVGSLELLGEGRTQTSCRIHAAQRNGGLQQLRVPAEDADPATLWGGGLLHTGFSPAADCSIQVNPRTVFLCVPGPEQAAVPARRHPNSRRLPGEAAAQQPPLRPAAQPALPPSLAGQSARERRGVRPFLLLLCSTPSVPVAMATGPVRAKDGFIWRHRHSPPTWSPSD